MKLLTDDATWTSDGGGKAKAARKIVRGAASVARFATGVYRRNLSRITFHLVTVNDEAGVASFHEGHLLAVTHHPHRRAAYS